MADNCVTYIDIVGSEKSLDRIEKEMEQALSLNPLHTDFGNEWLGNLLLHIGHDEKSVIESVIRCRGEVTELERVSPEQLSLDTLSAWGPHVTCIEAFCRHYADDVKVRYEVANGPCWTNIPEKVSDGYEFMPIGDET